MKLYGCNAIGDLINRYTRQGGEVATIEEGCLGYGFLILYGEGLKTIVIKEKYLNDWSSAHTVRAYNKTPNKYKELIEQYA